MNKQGALIVFSGPSGVGKGTLMSAFLAKNPKVVYSVSATTREPRAGEQDGVNYHFISKEKFLRCVEDGRMLEYACYNGNYYGTLRDAVLEQIEKGNSVILEIEVQGALQISKLYPKALTIFVMPPSFEELRTRLLKRHTETPEEIERRLCVARKEMQQAADYDYIVINDDITRAADDLCAIIRAYSCSRERMKPFITEVCENA